ncbi:uncharacterized protein N0V96_005744 [Colletotrichum fioriniae]|uniref:uncharacterized protein n=1 Tax=Colletotrichum fioriniae TaxID=710243 RepID=UPI0032DB8202|nr:hypothetical protein N0V96_005744 [Colletotrichum fioriniae]
MAFQTNVFRNGAWVTEIIDLQTVLRGSTTNTSAVAPSLPAPPSCGILTRTVIDSPIARWDRYVSINELRKDGQLQEVLRKNDFGCRIRNALVIGNKYEHFRVVPDDPGHDHIKSEDEDDDTHMADIGSGSGISSSHGQFPPHLLLLILESGSFVFLFIKRDDERDALEFVASPSRYFAVADAQNKFVVYELESIEAMGDQFILDKAIKPIRAHQPRAVQGTILKMEFLYPRPEDENHVILLLIIAKADRSKMVIYEWERGDDLGQVLAEEKRGHRIAPEHRLPLLIIPLTVRSSFFAVSEHALGICKDPLQGPPDIETINPVSHPASPFHHGTSVPLWTAWDRPVRRRRYYDTKDLIYLAREDGVIVFFEFNTTDILGAAMNVGSCNCNISTAFTTMYDAYSDVAIVAGDSGPGMVFQVSEKRIITIDQQHSSRYELGDFEGVGRIAEHAAVRVVAVQIGKKPTVLFLDPETGEDLSLPQDKHGNATTFISGLGSQEDKIHAVYDWLFIKDGMTFHYLIVTTAGGRLLLVSPKKEESHDLEGNRRTRIRFSTKYRIKEKAPIYSIVGDGDSIIYCAGKILHWDVLDSVEKRLVRKKTYELNSPAISLRMVNGKISALTLSDSLVIIDHKAENTHGEMTQIHADQVTRKSNHFFDVGDDADPELTWPVTLLTGMDRSFTAVWTPWKQPKRELELVAEGPLPASIRKLQRGRVRPEWVATEHVPRYGSIPSTVDGAEVLGICLDGSLMHFSLLNLQAWRFLRLVENLALRSPLLFPYSYEVSVLDNEEYDAEAKDTPKSMKHINGNLLQQCIDKRVLQEIMKGDSNHDLFARVSGRLG